MSSPVTPHRFERVEYKYWARESQVAELVRFTAPWLVPDATGLGPQRNISLYLDTPRLLFFRDHEAELPDRFKLRVRRYEGDPTRVFTEIKRKVKSVVLKTRAGVAAADLQAVLEGRPVASDAPGYLSDFCRLVTQTGAVPHMLISCDRLAFRSPEPLDDVRLTIDSTIAYQPWQGDFFQPHPGCDLPIDGEDAHGGVGRRVLVELKFPSRAPRWMASLTEFLGLRRTAYSKYMSAVRHHQGGSRSALGRVARTSLAVIAAKT